MKKKLLGSLLLSSYLFAGSYDNGIEFYKAMKYEKAMNSFLIATNNENNKAMLVIGIMYANGDGVKKDPIQSLKWFKKAANEGNIHAYSKLGNIYAAGVTVKQDYEKAAKWFKKAADAGVAKAAYNLGYFYTGGLGVKMNLQT